MGTKTLILVATALVAAVTAAPHESSTRRHMSGLRAKIAKAAHPKDSFFGGKRGLQLAAGDSSSWACGAGEDPATSCCGAVPAIFDVFKSSGCASHFPIVATALGISEPSSLIPGTSPMPHYPSAMTTALDAYCPSYCAAQVQTVIDKYRTRDAVQGRLCPQVLDGLWRLDGMCMREGAGDMSGAYCLPTYTKLYDAFSSARAATTQADLDGLCGSPCLQKVVHASVDGAAQIGRSLINPPSTATQDALDLARYAQSRSAAVTRMSDLLCAKDPSTSRYCVVTSNLLSRPDTSLAAPKLISPAPPAAAAEAAAPAPAAAAADASRSLQTLTLFTDGPEAGSELAAAPTSDLEDGDDFSTSIQPARRPGFACTACGRTLITGLLDLADLFGVSKPAGEANPSADALRAVLNDGCAHGPDRTCIRALTDSTPASAHYDSKLGLAAQSLGLCAEFASQAAAGTADTCPQQCSYALSSLHETFGCCLGPWLRMHAAQSGGAIPDTDKFIAAAGQKCGVKAALTTNCTAATRRFVALRLQNVNPSFASNGQQGELFKAALATDLARYTSALGVYPGNTGSDAASVTAGNGVLRVVKTVTEGSGKTASTIAIVSVLTNANSSSSETVSRLQSGFTTNSVALHNVAALVAAAKDKSAPYPLSDASEPVTVSDATAAYAPGPEPADMGGKSSGASAAALSTGVALFMTAAAAVATWAM